MLKEILENKSSYLMILFAFMLPFRHEISFTLAIISVLLLFFDSISKTNFKANYTSNKNVFFLFLLFLVYLSGLIYSSNLSFGFKDIDTKLPLLILPFSLLSINFNFLVKIFKAFISGCLIALFFCLISSTNKYLDTNNYSSFFYDDISIFMHTSYFSMYILTAILFTYFIFQNALVNRQYYKLVLFSILNLIFILMIFLLSSKAGVLIAGIIFFILIIHDLLIVKKIIFSVNIIIQSLIFILVFPKISGYVFNRFEAVKSSTENISEKSEQVKNNSSSSRIVLWKSSLDVFRENALFGVGTGDIKDELFKKYKSNDFQYGIDLNYNSHNQYLQFLATFGIYGVLILFTGLFYMFKLKYLKFNLLSILFFVIVLLNLLAESMFETRAGVEFFSFFFVILTLKHINNDSIFTTSN